MEQKRMKTGELLRRFAPYYRPYILTLLADLFCASMTTVCELVLPMILRYMTLKWDYRQECFSKLSDFAQESFPASPSLKPS